MAITIDDFSKIWASTSPLTPYSFSDDNYKEGWNFVGATPPSRQMWDSIQKSNDEKLKYLLDNFADYLPLAGGTMTGAIVGNPLTLSADDGNDSADLVLDPSGSATWNGKEVERVNASGTDYIRYESGLQIYFGYITPNTDGTAVTFTFPVPFINTPASSCTVGRPGTSNNYNYTVLNSVATTSLSIYGVSNGNGSWMNASVRYIVMGYWK